MSFYNRYGLGRTKIIDDLENVASSDILAGYKPADTDENEGTSYYGFLDTAGNWYIMKRVVSGAVSEITYSKGTSSYATNWTGRAGLSYGTFAATF